MFHYLGKETDNQTQEVHRVPNMKTPKSDPQHLVINASKAKEVEQEKNFLHTREPHKTMSKFFSVETMEARRKRHNAFKVLKGKVFQPRVLYLAKLSFRMGGERKNFPDRQKLK